MGHALSSLQVSAVYYRLIGDEVEQYRRDNDQLRYALLGSSGHISFASLFPELANAVQQDDSAELEDVDEDETITYKFNEQPELTPEEMERELMAMLAGSQDGMTANGGELYGPPGD